MPLFVNTNTSALNAQRQLLKSGASLDTAFMRLKRLSLRQPVRMLMRRCSSFPRPFISFISDSTSHQRASIYSIICS